MALTIRNTKKPVKQKVDGEGQARVLTPEQLKQIISHLDNRWATIFSLCYLMGARINEVLTLEVADIGQEVITLRARKTKTKKLRQIATSEDIKEVLAAYKGMPESGLMFEGGKRGMGTGKPISRASAHKALAKAADKAGITGVSTHSFRRSFATHLREAGWHTANIQDVLGHSSVQTTARYIG